MMSGSGDGLIGSVGWWWTSFYLFYRWPLQYSRNINPAEMTRPKIELNLESPDAVRAEDFVGGSLTLSSEVVGIMLGILLGLDVSIVDSGVGWLVGLSSIFGDGDTNFDIGNNDGYDEGCCFASESGDRNSIASELTFPSPTTISRDREAILTYWHTAGSEDLVGENAASAAVFSINVMNRRVVGGVILWPRRWCSCSCGISSHFKFKYFEVALRHIAGIAHNHNHLPKNWGKHEKIASYRSCRVVCVCPSGPRGGH